MSDEAKKDDTSLENIDFINFKQEAAVKTNVLSGLREEIDKNALEISEKNKQAQKLESEIKELKKKEKTEKIDNAKKSWEKNGYKIDKRWKWIALISAIVILATLVAFLSYGIVEGKFQSPINITNSQDQNQQQTAWLNNTNQQSVYLNNTVQVYICPNYYNATIPSQTNQTNST